MIVMRNGRREAMQEKFAECSDPKRSPQIISQLGDLRIKIAEKKLQKKFTNDWCEHDFVKFIRSADTERADVKGANSR